VHLQIYVCPEGQNDLGRFLAWSDAWYKRHVFSPFVGAVPLAPQYAINETFPSSLLDDCAMHATLPVNLLREMLQHYVRSAEHTENIKVYDVQCWTEEDKKLRRLSTTDSFLDADGDFDLFGQEGEKKKVAAAAEEEVRRREWKGKKGEAASETTQPFLTARRCSARHRKCQSFL
jgi:hypothetical protein